jgi:hypothetical protein
MKTCPRCGEQTTRLVTHYNKAHKKSGKAVAQGQPKFQQVLLTRRLNNRGNCRRGFRRQ